MKKNEWKYRHKTKNKKNRKILKNIGQEGGLGKKPWQRIPKG